MTRTVADVSDEAVVNATGRDWETWLEYLDDETGSDADHRTLVAAVRDAGVDSGWWQQKVAVGYEQERGGRKVGETAESGFQVGVQRTVSTDPDTLWDYLLGTGLTLWLGDVDDFSPEPGTEYETTDGTTGEIRTVAAGERLRLTWQPTSLDDPATLQLTLACPRNTSDRTTLRVHLEHLPDAEARDAMKTHWQAILEDIQAGFSEDVS